MIEFLAFGEIAGVGTSGVKQMRPLYSWCPFLPEKYGKKTLHLNEQQTSKETALGMQGMYTEGEGRLQDVSAGFVCRECEQSLRVLCDSRVWIQRVCTERVPGVCAGVSAGDQWLHQVCWSADTGHTILGGRHNSLPTSLLLNI